MKQRSFFRDTDTTREETRQIARRVLQANQEVSVKSVKGPIAKTLSAIVSYAQSHLQEQDDLCWSGEEADLSRVVDACIQTGYGFLDTETDGLDPMRDDIVGFSLCALEGASFYFPLRHSDAAENPFPHQMDRDAARRQLERLASVRMVYHNSKFDMRVIQNALHVTLPLYWDTATAAHYLNENEVHRLKVLWSKYCNPGGKEAKEFRDLFASFPFRFVPIEIAYLYAADDPIKTRDLFLFQRPFLEPESEACQKQDLVEAARFFHSVEMPLVPVVARMEQTGVQIDLKLAAPLQEVYEKKIEALEQTLRERVKNFPFDTLPQAVRDQLSTPINFTSPAQLGIVLFQVLKMHGPVSTDRKVLERLQEDYPQHYDLIEDVLTLKAHQKLLGTYIRALPQRVHPETGRVHGTYNTMGAVTGRFSSQNPNLQNIPNKRKDKDIRRLFSVPDGYAFLSADFKQQEPRILAHLSEDPNLLRAYQDGLDLYAWMGSIVYQVPYEQCMEHTPDGQENPKGKARRDAMKILILALMYGRGVKSTAAQLHTTQKEAKALIAKFFSSFPRVQPTIERLQNQAREKGYVKTVMGRKRRLPNLNMPVVEVEVTDQQDLDEAMWLADHYAALHSQEQRAEFLAKVDTQRFVVMDNSSKVSGAERQCLNSVVQGTAADVTKKAMLAVGTDEQLREWGYEMLLTIHDEICGMIPIPFAREGGERVRRLMIEAVKDDLLVPMDVDLEITDRWQGTPLEGF